LEGDEKMPVTPETFPEILKNAQEGEAAAQELLLRCLFQYFERIPNVVHGGLRGRGGHSDVVQESLIRIAPQFRSFNGETLGDFLTWGRSFFKKCRAQFCRTHIAKRRDFRRGLGQNARSSTPEVCAGVPTCDSTASHQAMRAEFEELRQAEIDTLPLQERTALQCKESGLTVEQIAAQLELSRGHTARLIAKARMRLAQSLSKYA